jgi:serine/threonine protein kinase
MNDYNVINQIGKGSFSNVHLCRRKRSNSSLLMLSGIYDDDKDEDEEDLFIIKEINLDSLVKKYVKKSRIEMRNMKHLMKHDTQTVASGTKSVSITPYNTDNKVLLQQLDSEEEYYYKRLRDLIESEIEVLNKLDHKNIIKYFSYDTKDQIYYIKMEYCQYGDLYSILKDYKLSDFKLRNTFNGFEGSFIKKFLKDTVNAISYVHGLNIIHRDIKLHNFLVKKDKDNQFLFKLSDFGFACFDLDCKLNDSLSISDFDFSASALKRKYYKLCGTPYYMAPEIILNIEEFEQLISDKVILNHVKFYDKKVDLWSYGICLYELIFNMLPFSDIYDIHDLKAFFSKATTQIDLHKNIDKKTTIDSRIKTLLKRLLTINPSFRISTEELVEFIAKFDIPEKELVIDNSIVDIINCKENVYQTNEIMKENVMKQSLNMDKKGKGKEPINTDSWVIEDGSGYGHPKEFPKFVNSWDKINKASSLIMKISVDNNFMKWLLNKK